MAQAAPVVDRGQSPLASNNPFRNRIAPSTSTPTVTSPTPISTNPFLDSSEIKAEPKSAPPANGLPFGLNGDVADFFARLGLKDNKFSLKKQGHPPNGVPSRENIPPRPSTSKGPHRRRPSGSEEDRRRLMNRPRAPAAELDIFADPPELPSKERRPPRRNSESSVRDKPRDLDPEAEKRRRERRHREGRSSHRKPNKKLDIIDKLDVTSIYGTGLFHHDGPFDACNPHRNRKGSKQAPMQAFPKDSANMQLGGSGPVHSKLNLDQYNGTGQEAHVDYNEAAVADDDADYFRRPQPERSASFNPTNRAEPIHGPKTAGLGTSTFLEGTPASRAAIERRQSEFEEQQQAAAAAAANGLSRKKSLAQRIKSVRPRVTDGRTASPEPLSAGTPTSPMGNGKTESNTNPFFKDHDKETEKKGPLIGFDEEPIKSRPRAPSSPKRGFGLERQKTADSLPDEAKAEAKPEKEKSGGGFLSRVKSVKAIGRSRTRERTRTIDS